MNTEEKIIQLTKKEKIKLLQYPSTSSEIIDYLAKNDPDADVRKAAVANANISYDVLCWVAGNDSCLAVKSLAQSLC